MISQRLIVFAVAVALRRGHIAILLIVILGRSGRRFLAAILGRLALPRLLAGSAHILSRLDGFDLNLTAIDGHINLEMRNLHCLFPPFGVKGGEDS
jgi:hypothetical protein